MKPRRKLYHIKQLTYSLLLFTILLISGVLSYGNIDNFSWDSIFKKASLSNIDKKENSQDLKIHFLDVGKADSAYIKYKDYNILIDAADKEPTDTVCEYLAREGVSKLDLVIVSHPHRDHIGQMDKVINKFEIGKFIEPEIPDDIIPTSVTYEKMLKALVNKNVKVKIAHPNDVFNIEDLKLEVLGPISKHKNLNNNSLVVRMTYKDVSFLFTGDAEEFEESEIISTNKTIESDVLKVAHHGSKTSSTLKFLKKVSPKYAVISVDSEEVTRSRQIILDRLKSVGAEIYRTDLHGNILFSTDGHEIDVKTEK